MYGIWKTEKMSTMILIFLRAGERERGRKEEKQGIKANLILNGNGNNYHDTITLYFHLCFNF